MTRNVPKEKLRVGIVTESLKHAHLPENIVCLSHVTMHHGIYEALVQGIGSLWIFVSADNKTLGRIRSKDS